MFNPTSGRLLEWLAENLAAVSETPNLDASVLLAAVLGQPRAWVLAHPEASLGTAEEQTLTQALARLRGGEPLPYVLGEWELFVLRFKVTPAALIPRPETELMVEQALAWLRSHPDRRRALDAGTGTGCIAASLAAHCPDLVCTAVDISAAALELARHNITRLGLLTRIHLAQSDLLSAFAPKSCDLLCANLPYIPSADLEALFVARFEPRQALDGGRDGLQLIRRLLEQARRVLAPGGLALLEIEERQGPAAQALAVQSLPKARIDILPDLAGKPRLLSAALSPL